MKPSIIIPSYNSRETIADCLSALLEQSYSGPYEIIVADSSQDGTAEIIKKQFPQVKLLTFSRQTDPGTARNKALELASGDLILFIDSDCVAAPDWLQRMVENHQNENYAAVGGCVLNGNDEQDLVGWAGYLAEFREFLPSYPRREVDHIPTCNISYKRVIFDQIGRFDPGLYPQEDLVFNYQLRQKGHRILFDPQIRVYHHHRSRLSDFLRHQYRIGGITAKVLKEYPLPGHWLVRHKAMVLGGLFFLPIVKFLRTVKIFFKRAPYIVKKKPAALLIFLTGLAPWTVGFVKESLRKS